jgi:hypothetical protein
MAVMPGRERCIDEEEFEMAKKEFPRFVTPDSVAREAEAAKTTRLRALRLAREAEAAAEKKDAAEREAAAKLAKSPARRRVRAAQPPIPPEPPGPT